MNIVGIIGKAGSGKDTVADMLHELRYDKIAFADPLKRFCMDVFEFTEEQLWGPSEKRSEPDERYLMWTLKNILTVWCLSISLQGSHFNRLELKVCVHVTQTSGLSMQ